MKSHTVKSNAKRTSANLVKKFGGMEVGDPVAADGGLWFPSVRVSSSAVAKDIADEVFDVAIVFSGMTDTVIERPVVVGGVDLSKGYHPNELQPAAPVFVDIAPPAEVDVVALAASLPPRKVSTPEEIAARRAERLARMEAAKSEPKSPRGGAKTEAMLALLKRDEGATVSEIAEANGWLPHTTRAAISVTTRKVGLTVTKEKVEGRGTVYRAA